MSRFLIIPQLKELDKSLLLAEKYGLGGRIEEVEGGLIDYVDVPELSRAVVISVEK